MAQAVADALEPAAAADLGQRAAAESAATSIGAWAELVWSIPALPGASVAARAAQMLPWEQIVPLLPGLSISAKKLPFPMHHAIMHGQRSLLFASFH